MSHELFYTSAPNGVLPGGRGFCTVAHTKGMPAPLMEKVESLSGYRPLFPPLDAQASLNPVAFAHLRLTLGNKTYNLLSRICSAGLDYSERTNKFAHHVVLEAGELPAGGPAWLLRQPGFLETSWNGEVQVLPAGRTPPRGDTPPAVCRAWQQQTSDAGWAGVVAESFAAQPGRLVYLLFEPGMDLLPLIVEALHLLPAEQRWAVTFSTYFTGLPQGIACAWRGVPRDSAEATSGRRMPGALVLDLCEPLGKASGGALVERARTGLATARGPVPALVPEGRASDSDPGLRPVEGRGNAHAAKPPPPPALPRLARPEAPPSDPPPRELVGRPFRPPPANEQPPAQPADGKAPRRPASALAGAALGAAAGILLTVGAGAGYLYYSGGLAKTLGALTDGDELDGPGLKVALLQARETASNLKDERDETLLKVIVLERENSKLRNQLAEPRAGPKEPGGKGSNLERDNTQLRGRLGQLERDSAGLRDQLAGLEKDNLRLRSQVDDLHAKLKTPSKPPATTEDSGPKDIHKYVQLEARPEGQVLGNLDDLDLEATPGETTLALLGLPEKPFGEYRLQVTPDKSALSLELVHDDQRRRLAEFRMEAGKIVCKWLAPGEVKTAAEQALRALRDSILQVKGAQGETRNLALREPRIITLNDNIPLVRQREPFQKMLYTWNAAEKPGPPLFLGSFEVEVEGQAHSAEKPPGKDVRELEVIPNHEIPNDRVIKSAKIKVEKDKEAIWLTVQSVLLEPKLRDKIKEKVDPKEKPKPRLAHVTVKSLVVYMKVNDLQVEVARVGKRTQ